LWGTFLPLGAKYSLDSYFSKEKPAIQNAYCSMASAAFICQLIMIYTFTALARTHACWLKDNTALNYGLQYFPYLTKPFATWLLNFPEALKPLTFVLHRLELYGGLLLLIPRHVWLCRTVAILAFVMLHIGVYLTFKLDPFPQLMIIGWFALIPSGWWDRGRIFENPENNNLIKKNVDYMIIFFLGIVLLLNCRFVTMLHLHQQWKPLRVESFFENIGLKQRWKMFNLNQPNSMSRWEFIPVYSKDFSKQSNHDFNPIKSIDSIFWVNLSEEAGDKYIPFIKTYLEQQWRKADPSIVSVMVQRNTWFITPR